MAEKAHVTSIEALELFRLNLIVYVSKARPALEEVSADLLRTRMWLQNDQRLQWEYQFRRREKELQQAEQAFSSARLSSFRQDKSTEQNAVRKAKRALEEAEAKLKTLKHWNREFDNRVDPMAKQLEKLHSLLAIDMVQATAYLSQAIDTLAAYAEMAPGQAPTASATVDGAPTSSGIAATDGGSGPPVRDAGTESVPEGGKS
jgi:chromosome segregation ATPase